MNKKAILKELVDDPEIKALYKQGFSRSVVSKLVIESVFSKKSSLGDKLGVGKDMQTKLSDLNNPSQNKNNNEETEGGAVDELRRQAKEFIKGLDEAGKSLEDVTGIETETLIDTVIIVAEIAAWLMGVKTVGAAFGVLGKAKDLGTIVKHVHEEKYTEATQLLISALGGFAASALLPSSTLVQKLAGSKIGEKATGAIVGAATKGAIGSLLDKFAGTEVNYDELEKEYGNSEFMQDLEDPEKLVVYKFLLSLKKQDVLDEAVEPSEIVNKLADIIGTTPQIISSALKPLGDEAKTLLSIFTRPDKLDQFVKMISLDTTTIQQQGLITKDVYQAALKLVKDKNNKIYVNSINNPLSSMKQVSIAATEISAPLVSKNVPQKTANLAVVKAAKSTIKEPTQEEPPPTDITGKQYQELYNKYLEDAFNSFDDLFLTTPYLGIQSKAINNLHAALNSFKDKLDTAEKPSINRAQLQEQEVEKHPLVVIDRKDQKLIMSEHKEMEKYLKLLVKLVLNIDEKKINTFGFEEDSKKIRLVAKKLKNSIEDLIKVISQAQAEKKRGLEFKESLNEEKQPRTQLTREQLIAFMEDGYAKVVDHLTNIEREARDPSAEVDRQATRERITKADQVIKSMLPYFPAHAPFGKEGDLTEIKKQVRAVSRDVIQAMNQAKNLVEKPEKFDENAIDRFKTSLESALSKIVKYFDLEIDDPNIKAMLPTVPPANSASFGKNSQGLFDKAQEIIDKYDKPIANSIKKGTISTYRKVKALINKKLKETFKGPTDKLVPQVLQNIPGVTEKEIDKMEVVEKFVNFLIKMKQKGILGESLGDLLKSLEIKEKKKFGRDLSKLLTKAEMNILKKYLENQQNLQDLMGVVKASLGKEISGFDNERIKDIDIEEVPKIPFKKDAFERIPQSDWKEQLERKIEQIIEQHINNRT